MSGVDRRQSNQEMWDRLPSNPVFIDVEPEDIDGLVTPVYNLSAVYKDKTVLAVTRKSKPHLLRIVESLLDNSHEEGYSILITPNGTR